MNESAIDGIDYIRLTEAGRKVRNNGWVGPLHETAEEHLGSDVRLFQDGSLKVDYLAKAEIGQVAIGNESITNFRKTINRTMLPSFYKPTHLYSRGIRIRKDPTGENKSLIIAATAQPPLMVRERLRLISQLEWQDGQTHELESFSFRIVLGALDNYDSAQDVRIWLPSKLPEVFRLDTGHISYE